MSSACISKCVNDTRVPVRASYVNLYKWPESDAEFVKSVGSWSGTVEERRQHPYPRIRPTTTTTTTTRVVDSVSCRQMYLRSYTFSRKETMPQRTKKCLGRVKERVAARGRRSEKSSRGTGSSRTTRCAAVRRAKELSCAALCAIFQRLLSCTATVDVLPNRDYNN